MDAYKYVTEKTDNIGSGTQCFSINILEFDEVQEKHNLSHLLFDNTNIDYLKIYISNIGSKELDTPEECRFLENVNCKTSIDFLYKHKMAIEKTWLMDELARNKLKNLASYHNQLVNFYIPKSRDLVISFPLI